jgi:pimeloyl-ACP methyl ester carboxylesterase
MADANSGTEHGEGSRVGILFVHGMGDHAKGSTLERFGSPIIEWLSRWKFRDLSPLQVTARTPDTSSQLATAIPEAGSAEMTGVNPAIPGPDAPHRTFLRESSVGPDTTPYPYASLTVSRPASAGAPAASSHWTMAEAWWADAFAVPPFFEVAHWGLGVGPRLIVRQFEPPGVALRGWPQPIRYAVALPVVLLFQVTIVLLLILGALPFARNYVKTLILKLIGSFGDVMILLSSSLKSSAISTAVHDALDWLRNDQGCERVAIVAHSLGTVISYKLLERDAGRVGRFVTFGAAIKKASILRHVQRNQLRLSLGIVLAALGVTLLISSAIVLAASWDNFTAHFRNDAGNWDRGGVVDWAVPYAILLAGITFCVARLSLWRETSPVHARLVGPAGCAIALIVSAFILGDQPRMPRGASWDISGLSAADTARLLPFALALALMVARELRYALDWQVPNWLYLATKTAAIQACLVLGSLTVLVSTGDTARLILPLAIAGQVMLLSAVRVPFGNGEIDDSPTLRLADDGTGSRIAWLDFWATSDPVPDGGLADATVEGNLHLESVPVHNRYSLTADHSIYTENSEEFTAALASLLVEYSGLPPLIDPALPANADLVPDDIARQNAIARRIDRVRWLRYSRQVQFVCFLLLLPLIGLDRLRYLSVQVLEVLRSVLNLILDKGVLESIEGFLSSGLLGALLVLLGGVAWYRLVAFPTWRQWDKADETVMFRRLRERNTAARWRQAVFWIVGYALPVVFVLAAVVARWQNWEWLSRRG